MVFEDFQALLTDVFTQNHLQRFLDPQTVQRFYDLTCRMLEVNKSMNLTAIKDEAGVALLHYADSLTVEQLLPVGASVADIGCGAGFPSLPLGIARPDLSITAVDSTDKRIRYVADTATLLDCKGITARTARAEELGHTAAREAFDVVTARAVAALPLLCELCLPLVRVGGVFLAMKAKKGEEETAAAATAIEKLGGKLCAMHKITLSHGERTEERVIVEIKKVAPTPAAYPRAWGKILKKPL